MPILDDVHATVHRIESLALWLRDAVDDLGRYTGGIHPYTQWKQTNDLLHDPIDGLANIRNLISNLNIDRIADKAEILAAIAALPDGSGLINPTPGIAASDVWSYMLLNATPANQTADSLLALAGQFAGNVGSQTSFPMQMAPDFVIEDAWADQLSLWQNYGWQPTPDYTAILPADTVLSWLNRTDTTYTGLWTYDAETGTCQVYPPGPGDRPARIRCLLHDWQLGAKLTGAPIWPGIAGVTLGTPVELTDSAIIDEPMDGVLLTVDAVGPRVGNWAVSPFTSYYRAGYLLFLSAEGHAEAVQYIGPTDAVYCRQSMSLAASVVVKLNGASQVTVTPWTLL